MKRSETSGTERGVIRVGQGFDVHAYDRDDHAIAQAPNLAPSIGAIQRNIAEDLTLNPERVNLKVASGHHSGSIGREEDIAGRAACLLESRRADRSPS